MRSQAQFVGMKKWLLRIGLGFFGLLLLLYGFVMLRSLLPVTVNDGNLQLARASIPAGSNAFDVLQTASSHVWWPADQSRQLSDLVGDTNWNASLADTVIAKNSEALAGWDAAAKLTDLQVPEVNNANTDLSDLSHWKQLSQLAAVRENVLFHKGQDKEAFDQMVNHVHVGQLMKNSHGTLIDYLVGVAVCNMGLNQMQHWAGRAFDPGPIEGLHPPAWAQF